MKFFIKFCLFLDKQTRVQRIISNKVGFDETIKSVSEKISIIPISLHIISTHLNGDETQ